MTENFHIGCINCAVIWKRLFGKKSIWERVFGNSNTKTHFKIADLKEDIVNSNVSYCASFCIEGHGQTKRSANDALLSSKNGKGTSRMLFYSKHLNNVTLTVWKVSRYGVISGPYFPVFGLNTERYSVSLRIQ